MHSIDIFVQNYFETTRTLVLTKYMYIFTSLFDLTVYSLFVFFFIIILIALVRNIRSAFLFTSSILFGCITVYLAKLCFEVSRPTDGVMLVLGNSFPSYHATVGTIFFIMLMYVFDDYFKPIMRVVFNTICILGIFTVAFSRVYLGVHWFSDVFFGVILGALLSYFFIIIFRNKKRL